MTNNKTMKHVKPEDIQRVKKGQIAVLRVYTRLGNWRAVGKYYRINHRYAWDLAVNRIVPFNREIRLALGLPAILPSERIKRIKKIRALLGGEGWENTFFRVPRKFKLNRKPKLITGR